MSSDYGAHCRNSPPSRSFSLPEAGKSVAPFLCVCFFDLLPECPIVFTPAAPDIVSVAPLTFGVPIPVPP
jgi:hypothetical protein